MKPDLTEAVCSLLYNTEYEEAEINIIKLDLGYYVNSRCSSLLLAKLVSNLTYRPPSESARPGRSLNLWRHHAGVQSRAARPDVLVAASRVLLLAMRSRRTARQLVERRVTACGRRSRRRVRTSRSARFDALVVVYIIIITQTTHGDNRMIADTALLHNVVIRPVYRVYNLPST